jgi:hypothetical protein
VRYLEAEPPRKTKLIIVPSKIVEDINEISNRIGVSISNFATEALQEALRVYKMKASLKEAVDLYRLVNIQQDAGAVNIPRNTLNQIIEELYSKEEEKLKKMWYDAGRWYGEYLNTKLGEDEALSFLEKDLKLSWNLNEVEIKNKDHTASIRCVSFMMSQEFTELLQNYISGVMTSMRYKEAEKNYIRGIITLKYNKII